LSLTDSMEKAEEKREGKGKNEEERRKRGRQA
jgi:hypothetical protein